MFCVQLNRSFKTTLKIKQKWLEKGLVFGEGFISWKSEEKCVRKSGLKRGKVFGQGVVSMEV